MSSHIGFSSDELFASLAVVAVEDLLDRPKHDARSPDLFDAGTEPCGVEARELDVGLDAPPDLAETAFGGPRQRVLVRVASTGEESRRLSAHGLIDDHGQQRASDPLATICSRDRHAAALRAIGVPECAAVADVGHRGEAAFFILDDEPKE
jgi:hypothetical protein